VSNRIKSDEIPNIPPEIKAAADAAMRDGNAVQDFMNEIGTEIIDCAQHDDAERYLRQRIAVTQLATHADLRLSVAHAAMLWASINTKALHSGWRAHLDIVHRVLELMGMAAAGEIADPEAIGREIDDLRERSEELQQHLNNLTRFSTAEGLAAGTMLQLALDKRDEGVN
jgi:hypothetical protein